MGPKAPPSGHIKDGLLGRSEDSVYPTSAGLSATPSRLSPRWDLPLSSSGPSRGSLFRAPPQRRQGRRAQSDTLLPAMSRLLSPPWSRPTVGKWLPWLPGPLPPRPGQGAFEYARYFAESAVSPPAPTPALCELGSAQRGYSGFLISPGPDKLLIKRALPPIPFTVAPPRSPEGGAQGCCCPPPPPWSAGLIHN